MDTYKNVEKPTTIRLAGLIDESITDGPGIRYTIFTQGCNHRCVNCQNKGTWDFSGGKLASIEKVTNDIIKKSSYLDGVTFSGGDPMYQPLECLEIAKAIKANTSLSIWCYTGFMFEELKGEQLKFLNYIDVLVDGMYEQEHRNLALKFRGSSNQRIIDIVKTMNNKDRSVVTLDI